MRAYQRSSDLMKILKNENPGAQTTARFVSCIPSVANFLINRVLNLTKLRSIIHDQSVDRAVLFFESSSAQLICNLKGPECSGYS